MPSARRPSTFPSIPMAGASAFALALAAWMVQATPAAAQLDALDQALDGAMDAGSEEAPAPQEGEGAAAPEGEGGGEAAPSLPALVSDFCAFSFFTNGADTVDLRGSGGFGCVDTGMGRDVVDLRPADFPSGLELFSGRGRSVFRLPDSNVMVFDTESTAEEIRTGRGNDTIRLGVGFAGDGRVVRTPETRVFPGMGDNLVVIGSGLGDAGGGRHSPNARIFPDAGTLAVEAGCGRENDPDSLDAVVEDAGPGTRVSINAKGCGVAVRNHAAPTVWEQEGGRMVALLRPTGEEGSTAAFFEAQARRGAGLSFAAIEPHPGTVLDWQGLGDATLQIDSYAPGTGGSYTVEAGGMVFARVVTRDPAQREARPEVGLDLASAVSVELVLEGDGGARVGGSLIAPEVRVTWRPTSSHDAPALGLGETRRVEARGADEGLPLGGAAASGDAASGGEAGAIDLADVDPYAAAPEGGEGAVLEATPAPAPEQPVAEAAAPVEDATPAEEGASEESVARDEAGRTEAGRLALVGGFPPGSTVAPPSERWSWRSSPVSVFADRVVLTIEAPSSWCTRIGVEGTLGARMADCGAAASFEMGDQVSVRIETPDGAMAWSMPGLEAAAVVELVWAPTR